MWLYAYAFDSTCKFQVERCLFRFQGREFAFYSGNKKKCEVFQTIVDSPKEKNEVFQIIHKFVFCYGWANHCAFQFRHSEGRYLRRPIDLLTTKPMLVAERGACQFMLTNFEYIMLPATPGLELALSLYNDAEYTIDYFYKFICYWKILEIPYLGRKFAAVGWINHVIKKGYNIHLTDYIRDLISKNVNIGKFFLKQRRNAILHITRPPTLVSFKADDYQKIISACSAIKPFVKYFIRKELGVPKYNDKIEVIKKIDKTTSSNM